MKSDDRPRENIGPDDPIRLEEACEIVFHGALRPQSLRLEARRGNLVIERIAGKDFVTLAGIAVMREKCRIVPKPLEHPARGGPPSGEIEDKAAVRAVRLAKLAVQKASYKSAR